MASGGGLSVMTKVQNNRIHLFRLQMLIIDGGLLVLRHILDHKLNVHVISLDVCLKRERATIMTMRSRGIITQAQFDILFPPGGTPPSTLDMDITLILCLLRNLRCFGFNKSFNWSTVPASTDVTIEADLCRLKRYRNNISHISTTMGIQPNDFVNWWNDIEQLLIRQSSPALNIQQTISDLKCCPLDPNEEKRIQKEIKRWKDYESDVDRLKEEMKEVKEKFGYMRRNISDLTQSVGGIQGTVGDLTKDVGGMHDNFSDMSKEVSGIKETSNDLTKDVCDMQSNISILKIDVGGMTDNFSDLTDNLSGTQETISTMKIDVTDMAENVIDLTNDVSGIKENVGDLTKSVDEMQKNFSDVTEDVSGIKECLEEMKRKQDGTDDIRQRKKERNVFHKLSEKVLYPLNKKSLRDDMIKFYRRRHSKIQLSPLFRENDTPLASFYIRPEINEKTPGKKDEVTLIKTLSDMFKSESKDNKEIYLTADAGIGKTTFSKYLATSWCQAHSPEQKDRASFGKDDLDCMGQFDFVFLVLLRDSKDLCSIDDLLFELILSNLANSKKFDKVFLEEILNREKCLIILDGLDEWTHPENPGTACHLPKDLIPHRNDRESCTVLTTTRPWKIRVLNLSSNELGKQVLLTKLSGRSAGTLILRTIRRLKSLPDEKSSKIEADTLIEEINARKNADLAYVPLLLMYIMCLWCDGVKIGKSKCELYTNIVELLLSRTVAKHGELLPSYDSIDGEVPKYFIGHEHCLRYITLLVNLGKLAFHTLLNKKRENTLVFDINVAKEYLSKHEMIFSLHSGILTESTTKTLTKQTSKVSFSHKSVQEFMAAILMSSQNDDQGIDLERWKNVQSILDMSMIFEFLSKMNSNIVCEKSADFIHVINEDEVTKNYRTRTGHNRFEDISSEPMYNIQKMLVSCLQEMPENENIKLYLQDVFIESHTIHNEHLQLLSKLNKTIMKSLYINTHESSSSLYDIVESFSLKDLNNLYKLCYHGARWKDADISLLLFPNLQTVNLSSGIWKNNGENLGEKLKTLEAVQYLDIRDLTLCHDILETIYNFISGNTTIKELSLWWLSCKEHGSRCKINLNLSKNCQLRYANLRLINLGRSSLLLSRYMLNIEHVEWWDIKIAAISLHKVVKILEAIPHSVTVKIMNCIIQPETEYERLRNYLRSSQTFEVMRDDSQKWLVFQTRKPIKQNK